MSDYESLQRKRNFAVGVFVLAAVIALVWLIFKFGDLPVLVGEAKSYKIFVQFGSAPGVQQNTPVRFCGYQIGRVMKVVPPKIMKEVDSDRVYHQSIIVLGIDKEYSDIPQSVEAKLMSRGLGSSYIELKLTDFDANKPSGPYLEDGARLQGGTGITSEFFPEESQKKLEELVDNFKEMISNANAIIGDPNNQVHLKQILSNLTIATEKATAALEQLEKFSGSGANAADELALTLKETREVIAKVNEGEGSLSRMVNDGQLYEQLLESMERLEATLEELREFIAASKDQGLPLKLK